MSGDGLAVLRLCTECDGGAAHLTVLETALENASLDANIRVRGADCMGACDTPMALALQGRDRATYLFEGLDPARDLDDIVATCRAYLAAPGGWIEDARPCGRLRHCLRARIPSSGSQAAG